MGEAISGAPAAVQVLAVSRVTPAPAENAGRVKLSFLDAPWVPLSPVQHVFLYDLQGGGAEYSAAVRKLKESLATTLALYLPFAGMLSYDEQTRDVVIDLSDAGVAVFEAEDGGDGSSCSLDLRRLVMDKAHDVPAFLSLVPEHDARVLPAPVAAVQVTRLSGGACLALGVSMLHAVADGHTALRFYDAWASAARGTGSLLGPPHYGREAIVHPRGDEIARNILRSLAPNLPVLVNAEDTDLSKEERLARWTFNFSAHDIQSLKRRIVGETAEHGHKSVSTFVALAALAWTAFVTSKEFAVGDDTHLVFFADLRKRLHPPVDECYLGNCVKGCLASTDAGELLAEAGLVRASQAIKAAVMEMETAPLDGTELSREQLARLPVERMVNVAQGPQFKIYEATDFGFGRPRRVELVSTYRDGQIILRGGRHAGEVQLSVGLDEACIHAFEAHIKAYL
ncbi:hypothetical protein EJB05_54750, partial [Eragrostis curvula]